MEWRLSHFSLLFLLCVLPLGSTFDLPPPPPQVLLLLYTRFNANLNPKNLTELGRRAYHSRCQMFDQLTSLSVPEAVRNLDHVRLNEMKLDISFYWFLDAGPHWSFDPTCKEAVERANETLKSIGGTIITSPFTGDTSLDFFHGSLRHHLRFPSSSPVVLWSRLDSDDLIHFNSLKLMVEGVLPCALDKGFCFFSFLERAQWFLDRSTFFNRVIRGEVKQREGEGEDEGVKCGRVTNFWFPIHSQLQAYAFVPSILNCSTLLCIQQKGFEAFDHTKVYEFLSGAPSTHFPQCRENVAACTRFSCFGENVEGVVTSRYLRQSKITTVNPPPQCTFEKHPNFEPLVFWTMSPMQTSRWHSSHHLHIRKDPCGLIQTASVSPPFHFDPANSGCIALDGPQIGCHKSSEDSTSPSQIPPTQNDRSVQRVHNWSKKNSNHLHKHGSSQRRRALPRR